MSNLDRAREGYAAFARGDLPAALALLDDDVEWIVPGTSAVSGIFHGPDEVSAQWAALVRRDWRIEPEYWFADEERVCVLSHVRFAGGETDTADLLTFRDGRVVKFQTATDTELLLAAWPPDG